MLGNTGTYAMKKRKKPVQKPKKLPGVDGIIKSNPSKRHRDRLNGELDRLTDLLPFPEDVHSRLDKLSVLRLSVGYLRVKSFFNATMKKRSVPAFPSENGLSGNRTDTAGFSEGELLLQALSGFVMVVNASGLVFYASPTVQDYLGFHQSDVVHQSVYELIHTDDRATFREQLHFALNPKPFASDMAGDALQYTSEEVKYDPELLPPENSSFLERNFVCRFRCLLDNSSGFLALKFQGRLKFLHGQSILSEDGTHVQPQLALFAIATPVQTPSILEIRSKTLLFQTKHKLDFTPTGIDNRGKVVLGYSEIELCMRGSGYQFIHAADMMHCADNHLRIIKTGDSGMTVFRLLTKAGGWVWVQSNAKLIYNKDRMPDFIIARQRALLNGEGEEHLRQRRLQLPFSFTTGEAVLYETGPTLDVLQFPSDGGGRGGVKKQKQVAPTSLLDCFLIQDESAYTQLAEPPLPVDQVFMDSRALVNVPSDPWQTSSSRTNANSPAMMMEEGDRSVKAMIDTLESLAQDGDLCAALQGLDVDTTALMEWECALQKLSQDNNEEGVNNTSSELDSILTNDIFNYMDNVLFKESGKANLSASPSSCLAGVNNNQGEPFSEMPRTSATGLCEPPLFQGPNADQARSPGNGLCGLTQALHNGPVSMTGRSLTEPGQIFSSTQKLFHYGPLLGDANVPSLQQLQLNDIFTPSIELPGLTLPIPSGGNDPFQSCGQTSTSHLGHHHRHPGQQLSKPSLQQRPQNGMQASSGQLLQTSIQKPSPVVPAVAGALPSLVPGIDFSSLSNPSAHGSPGDFSSTCLMQVGSPFQKHSNHSLQQWPQNKQPNLPRAGMMQNGHVLPACHGQSSESQRPPPAGLWPQSFNRLGGAPQGELVGGQWAPSSSCMFDKPSLPLTNCTSTEGAGLAPARSSCQIRDDTPLDQSPPKGSCYFQWGQSEPVVGTSAIAQESATISPPSLPLPPPTIPSTLDMQRYLDCNKQTQTLSLPAEDNRLLSIPPVVDGNLYFSDQSQINCSGF